MNENSGNLSVVGGGDRSGATVMVGMVQLCNRDGGCGGGGGGGDGGRWWWWWRVQHDKYIFSHKYHSTTRHAEVTSIYGNFI